MNTREKAAANIWAERHRQVVKIAGAASVFTTPYEALSDEVKALLLADVDAVLDAIRDMNDEMKKRAQLEWDACHEDPMPQCRDGAHLWFGMIDAIKRGEG